MSSNVVTFRYLMAKRFFGCSNKQTIMAIAVLFACAWKSFAFAQPTSLPANDEQAKGYILYLPVPTDVSRDAVYYADEKLKDRLIDLTKELSDEQTLSKGRLQKSKAEAIDRLVIFTDDAGQPILPDLESSRSAFRINRLPEATASTGNEITFTFDSPSFPWSGAELAVLNTTLSDCYALTKRIYGSPAFNITVNVRQDPTISFSGLYYPSLNEMVLKGSSSPDVVCHELIHAFRDDNVIALSSFEEGMTRAAEVEVFNNLPAYTYWNNNHSYTYDVYYEALNKKNIGSRDGNFFFGYIGILARYQLSGYAWAKVLLENSKFLADFNRKLYARTLVDPTTPSTESKLINIALAVQPRVENIEFKAWYSQQGVLNTNPPKGYFLYQRINQFTDDYFYRDPSGLETMQPGATVNWVVYNHNNVRVDSGAGVTSANGWVDASPALNGGYTGRINVVATTMSPNGLIRDSALRYVGNEEGCFGVVRNANAGTITIIPLDNPIAPVTVKVVNGAFSAPSLASVRGRFRAVFVNKAGRRFSKRFNKDASNYFISVQGG